MKRLPTFLLSAFLLLPGLSAMAQTLEVGGEVRTPLTLQAADLKGFPREKVKAKDKDGVEAEFSGIPLHALLAKAGAASGEQLKGPAISQYVLITAADGYTAVLSLPEIDPLFTDNQVLVADMKDGKPLENAFGSLRLILPKDKRHARWVRQVVKVEVLKAPVPPKKEGASPYK